VLVEAGLGIGLILYNEGKYTISNTGRMILDDKLTRINMDFTNDVCYEGLMNLESSIKNGQPEGLKVLGNWNTIYEGLSVLPEPAKKSWFDFDHYYSDSAFGQAMKKVLGDAPSRLLDIGGNTGKFAMACAEKDAKVHITILDLPGQTQMARKNIEARGLSERIGFHEADILQKETVCPGNFCAVWMSQFLDCFSDEQIVSILKRCRDAVKDSGYIYILETFWDRQRFEASAFCLQMTSLYFTAMANGNSQMYDSNVFLKLVEQAGLEVVEVTDNIGLSHSLIKCKKSNHADRKS
jgi:ubiquinone/menaquinone biosynthesis C-methylase UbiE